LAELAGSAAPSALLLLKALHEHVHDVRFGVVHTGPGARGKAATTREDERHREPVKVEQHEGEVVRASERGAGCRGGCTTPEFGRSVTVGIVQSNTSVASGGTS